MKREREKERERERERKREEREREKKGGKERVWGQAKRGKRRKHQARIE